eukprot:TRINITY_DN1475_c0_g1_i1.p1 TRINITY_DN1475_c0_g1~~TRINITY_DN1475_c0_g1_i1.p1  ORF type:complete len:497 (+),score=102.72 TRINITY_DN1475_c0_g1_i1:162-1652(+)
MASVSELRGISPSLVNGFGFSGSGTLFGGSTRSSWNLKSRKRLSGLSVSCSYTGNDRDNSGRFWTKEMVGHDYYKVLGVEVDAQASEIRKAYWNLQKIYHPDVAGQEGHEMTLLLNEAYNILMDGPRRKAYEKQWRTAASAGYTGYTGQPRSQWSGPETLQALFVDEAACVGCQECVFLAPSTFTFDPSMAKARVKVQWGDGEGRINIAREACPVRCIHAVSRTDLPVLEYLMQPRKRDSHGVYGGGWETPVVTRNIFAEAQLFHRKIKAQQEEAERQRAASASVAEETPAQKAAREEADRKLRKDPWSWAWSSWGSASGGFHRQREEKEKKSRKPWATAANHVLGKASTSELMRKKVEGHDVKKTRGVVQEWAAMWSCSSELPLPLPFRADAMEDGVVLTLITTSSGCLESVGALVISITQDHVPTSAGVSADVSQSSAVEQVTGDEGGEWFLTVRREGVRDTRPLPGERRILKNLEDVLLRRDNMRGYEAYHLL